VTLETPSQCGPTHTPPQLRLRVTALVVIVLLLTMLGTQRNLHAEIIGTEMSFCTTTEGILTPAADAVLLSEPSLFADAASQLDPLSKADLVALTAEEPEFTRMATLDRHPDAADPQKQGVYHFGLNWQRGGPLARTRPEHNSPQRNRGLIARSAPGEQEQPPSRGSPKRDPKWGKIGENSISAPDMVCRRSAEPCVTKCTRLVQDLFDPPRGGTIGMVTVFWL